MSKCFLYGTNIDENKLNLLAKELGVNVGKMPFVYLGVKVGSPQRSYEEWEEVSRKIKNRIMRWEKLNLSIGGRLTLINSVLSSIPVYYLLTFLASKKVLNEIKQAQRNFVWGSKSNIKKIAWVKWREICIAKEVGGLGIRNLECFNRILLSKWAWRFFKERNSLWERIVESKYGVEWTGGLLFSAARKGIGLTGWWKDVIKETGGHQSEWFFENMVKIVGDGRETYFWEEKWIEGEQLKQRFPCLYQLSVNKEAKIAEMGEWTLDGWHWNWNWRRPLFGRELSLMDSLTNLVQQQGISNQRMDNWNWSGSSKGTFKIKEVYDWRQKLQHQGLGDNNNTDAYSLIWNSLAPSKVRKHAWRVLKERLPTKDLLLLKGVNIPNNEQSCVLCGEMNESVRHILFECQFSYGIWMDIFRWWGIYTVGASDHKSATIHEFLQR
ncbi:hypothetical protein ACS0TY_014665 [Phlomoides rotata]